MATIKIKTGNPTTGILELSDRGHTWENKGKEIKWKIKRNSNVASIENIELKSGSTNIFSTAPYEDDTKWRAVIDRKAGDKAESEYLIVWKDTDGEQHTHDPKISVMPSSGGGFITLLVVIISSIFALLTLGLFFKEVKR